MGDVALFPGTTPEDLDSYTDDKRTAAEAEAEALDVICERQSRWLDRWRSFGVELRRRGEHPLPIGLEIELYDLLNEIDS